MFPFIRTARGEFMQKKESHAKTGPINPALLLRLIVKMTYTPQKKKLLACSTWIKKNATCCWQWALPVKAIETLFKNGQYSQYPAREPLQVERRGVSFLSECIFDRGTWWMWLTASTQTLGVFLSWIRLVIPGICVKKGREAHKACFSVIALALNWFPQDPP